MDFIDKINEQIVYDDGKRKQEIAKTNNEILKVPNYLSPKEKETYGEIVKDLKDSIKYKLSPTDVELIWQYCQLKIMRDRAWREYTKNPDRYIRVVTGICNDGKTPKVMIKENEHYKTLIDCNKQLEKILKDLRLTPEMRRKL